jgi:PIN domain nuclease of toxin-antitoxin system
VKLLLDTVSFLDAAFAPEDIPELTREALLRPDSEIHVSLATIWEIVIKHALGKLKLPEAPEKFVRENRSRLGAISLAVDEESILHVARLPDIHGDPFDRMLIAQALVHGMVLVTPDARIAQYPVRTMW